jgi:hypothetical protein
MTEDGEQVSDEGMVRKDALNFPDSSLSVIPHCEMGDYWDFGYIDAPEPNHKDIAYLVSYGTNVMVQTSSLQILWLATNGRISPQRYWRYLMHIGWSENRVDGYGLPGVDYGVISEAMDQFPEPFPGLSMQKVVALEELGDVELIQQALIHQGNFWAWMRPDRLVHPMS